VAVLISQEEERRVFPGYEDALALSVAPLPPPGPPPKQPPRTPPARPRHEARVEPWDAWPRTTPDDDAIATEGPAWPAIGAKKKIRQTVGLTLDPSG
jgi:hypothetical protein